jgi:hypothetical protein
VVRPAQAPTRDRAGCEGGGLSVYGGAEMLLSSTKVGNGGYPASAQWPRL